MSDIVKEFMDHCIQSNIKLIPDICIEAQNKINELNKQIKTLELSKLELEEKIKAVSLNRNKLNVMKNQLTISPTCTTIDGSKWEGLSPYIQDTIKKIYKLFAPDTKTNSREIMESISLREHKAILTSIKWLLDNEILNIDGEYNLFVGINWKNFNG